MLLGYWLSASASVSHQSSVVDFRNSGPDGIDFCLWNGEDWQKKSATYSRNLVVRCSCSCFICWRWNTLLLVLSVAW